LSQPYLHPGTLSIPAGFEISYIYHPIHPLKSKYVLIVSGVCVMSKSVFWSTWPPHTMVSSIITKNQDVNHVASCACMPTRPSAEYACYP
jgi:hypothetical protein